MTTLSVSPSVIVASVLWTPMAVIESSWNGMMPAPPPEATSVSPGTGTDGPIRIALVSLSPTWYPLLGWRLMMIVSSGSGVAPP